MRVGHGESKPDGCGAFGRAYVVGRGSENNHIAGVVYVKMEP